MARTLYSPASRKNVDRETDPYIPRKSPSEIGICPKCRAICRNKRWVIDEAEFAALTGKRAVAAVAWRRCPACRKIEDGFPAGVVTLSGGYLREHRDDILNLIRNEEKRAMGINPLERIMTVEEKGDGLEIATTDEKLAQRIGREVRKACRGTVEYKWSKDSKLLRVSWAREE
ncbi:MAG: BCAM0308 family protein [Deltaproteobacteria bacterium]